MKKYVLFLFAFIAVSFSDTATQTDWSGGNGVPGPVTDWGNSYATSSNVKFTGATLKLDDILTVPHIVDANFIGAYSVYATDMDGDGDMDVLGAAYDVYDIVWWENTDGSGTDWVKHTVDGNFIHAKSVYAADVDDDGDMDVLGAASGSSDITWWENTDSFGTAWTEHIIDENFYQASSVFAADVDADGYMDVLGAAVGDDDITWWKNTDGTGTVWTEHTIDGDFNGANSVCTADVDGDGDMDVLGSAYWASDIAWFENTDGSGTNWIKHDVSIYFDSVQSACCADVDGDGDMDVLGAAYYADDITWWENTDGSGTDWIKHTINGDFDGATSVHAADVDDDGDMDVLGTSHEADDITWWENTDGSGIVWTEHTIDGDFDGARSVYTADVDGDGNMDVLGAAKIENAITWWQAIDYHDVGVLESSILDVETVNSWEQFSSNSQSPSGTSIAYQFRSSTDAADMGVWSDTVYSASTALFGILADDTRYIQYRVILQTSDNCLTPVLEDVSFNYNSLGMGESGITSWSLIPAVNPSCGHFTALVTVPEAGMVQLAVFDVTGRMIAENSQVFPIGTHSVIFEGLSEGIFFCVMNACDYTATERMVVLK